MNSRLPWRYAGWMARDAAIRPGLACLAIAAVFTYVYSRIPTGGPRTGFASPEQFLVRTVGQFDWLVTLIGTAGIVSWDRASGYYRSLFSQPLNPGLYYLQRWVLNGVAVAAIMPLMALGIMGISGRFPFSGPLLERLLLKFLLLGGLTFALSTLVRVDWLIALLISFLQSVLYGLEQGGVPLKGFTRLLSHALPPFQYTSGAGFGAAISYPTPPELLHTLLYGAGLLAVALTVLAFRPLGSGGRA